MRIDERGVIRHWGSALEDVYGYTSEEAVGRDLNCLIPQPLRSRHWKGLDTGSCPRQTDEAPIARPSSPNAKVGWVRAALQGGHQDARCL
jgi:hypothetical protein